MPLLEAAHEQLQYPAPLFFYQFFNAKLFGVDVLVIWDVLNCSFLLLAALNFFPALTATLAALFFFLVEIIVSPNLKTNAPNAPFFALVAIAVFSIASLGKSEKGSNYRPIAFAIETILPLVYFNAFVSKVLNGGWSWFNGETLRGYFYFMYLETGNTLALALSKTAVLCGVLAISTLAFEALFGLILLRRSLRLWFVCIALLFHLGVYVTMQINFFWMYFPVYFIYVDFSSIRRGSRKIPILSFILERLGNP